MPLLRWLAERGATHPLEVFERAHEEARHRELAEQAWRDATPPGLRGITLNIPSDAMLSSAPPSSVLEANRLLEAALPDPDDRVLALLRWYGVSGVMNGTPSYELLTMLLAKHLDLASILRALARGPVDKAVCRGVARHLLPIARLKPDTLREVPDTLWAQLRGAVVLSSDDEYFDERVAYDFDEVVAAVRARRGT